MTIPATGTDSPQPISLLDALRPVDRRAAVFFQEVVQQEKPTSSLLLNIQRIRQSHPECNTAVDLFLKTFPQIQLSCGDGRSILLPKTLASELSPVMDRNQVWDFSSYSPEVIQLFEDFFNGKDIKYPPLLSNIHAFLSITDYWQIASLTGLIAQLPTAFSDLGPEEIKELITSAKTHHNFLFYCSLLCHAAKTPSLIELLDTEEQKLLTNPLIKKIRISSTVMIEIENSASFDCYEKLMQFKNSPSNGAVQVTIKKPNLLNQARSVFEKTAFPEKLVLHSCNSQSGISSLFSLCQSRSSPSRLQQVELTNLQLGDQIIDALPQNTAIKELILSNCKLTNHACEPLQRYMSTLKSLEVISLKNNALSSCEAISAGLSKNPELHTLDLSGNHLNDTSILELNSSIKQAKKLSSLTLSHNPIKNSGAIALAEILQQPHSLERLYLSDCQIEDDGIQKLCTALTQNPLVYTLDLSSNPFTSHATAPLCALLHTSITLTILDISKTSITDDDVCALASSLENNKELQNLKLSETRIGDKAAIALATMLKKNQHLTELSLMSTQITDIGAKALLEALSSKEFFSINLFQTQISPELKSELETNEHVVI